MPRQGRSVYIASRSVSRRQVSVLPLLLLAAVFDGASAVYSTCYDALRSADASGDLRLTPEEYAMANKILSNGAWDATYDDMPASLQGGYSFGADSGSFDISGINGGSTLAQQQSTESLCKAMYSGLAEALGVTTTRQTCFIAMSIGDLDRDDVLQRDTEYPRFANQMSRSLYGNTASYDSLPLPVQAVFQDFDNGNAAIDVSGSKPGSTVSDDQTDKLANLCLQLSVAVIAGQNPPISTLPAPIAPAPVAAPTTLPAPAPVSDGPTEFSPSFTFNQCKTGMLVSDVNRDDSIDQAEYLRLLNRLAANAYISSTYDSLPMGLQAAYSELAGPTGQISVAGSKPGSTATAEDVANLENICQVIDRALQSPDQVGGGGGGSATPTPSPVAQETTAAPVQPAVEISYTQCTIAMVTSDINRNVVLEQNEFVLFLNKVNSNAYDGLGYDELPEALKALYQDNASATGVDIAGSRPGQRPTDDQQAFLEGFCTATQDALAENVTPAPSPPSGNGVDVFNAFVISNTASLSANNLVDGPDRVGLEVGYGAFVEQVVVDFQAQRRRRLRRRRGLGVAGLVAGSPEIYQIDDTPCPGSVIEFGALCQVVYAKFSVTPDGSSEATTLSSDLSQFSQSAITGESNLQSFVVAENPDSKVRVETAAPSVVPESSSPTPAPSTPVDPSSPPGKPKGGGEKSNAGMISGVVIGVLVGIGLAVYVYLRRRRGGSEGGCCPTFAMPSMPSLRGKKGTKSKDDASTGGDENDVSESGYLEEKFNPEQAMPSSSHLNRISSLFGGGSKDRPSVEDDEASGGFSVQEDEPDDMEKGSNRFVPFGKKKKGNVGGFDDSVADLQDNGAFDEAAGGVDFANYAFDEPALGNSKENIFGGSPGSPSRSWAPQGPDGDAWGDKNAFGSPQPYDDDEQGSASEGSGSGSVELDLEEPSYDDDDSDSDESDTYYGDEADDYTRATKQSVGQMSQVPEKMVHLNSMVENGDWDGVMAAAANLGDDADRYSSGPSENSEQSGEDFAEEPSEHSHTSSEGQSGPQDADDGDENSDSLTSEDRKRRDHYRKQVEDLVRRVVPDEVDNISAMMDQFSGREAELLNTLQTMYSRSTSQRARKAVHKSKALPVDSSRFSAGGTDGSAAIAAVSTLSTGSQSLDNSAGMSENRFNGGGDEFYSEATGSYGDEYGDEPEGSESYSGEEDNTGPYSDEQSGSYSDDRSGPYSDEQSGSYSDEEGTDPYSAENAGGQSTQYDDEYSDEGSYELEGLEGKRDDDDQSEDQSGSYSNEGSYVSGEEEGSYSEEGSQSYYSDDDYDD